MRHLLTAVIMALPGAAIAETPLFSMTFGEDALHANAGDIKAAEPTVDYIQRPALRILLDSRFDAMMAELTSRHVGEVGALLICGQIMSEPTLQSPIPKAEVIITGLDMDEVTRLAALLNDGTCEQAAES
jgi:preprotein translocase subunit SecD